jgi:hypothetical protein
LFCNEILVGEVLAAAVAPFAPRPLVEALCESLGETIREGLDQDRVVIVVLLLE